MSVAGISSSSFFNLTSQAAQSMVQQSRQEFQQLGQDLQSGNLTAAQADFASLQQLNPQAQASALTQSSNPIAQEFAQLSQDLQSGNISSAQQDYTKIQQSFQSQASERPHHHHHHGGGGGGSEISQLLAQLGQSLQSGNLTTAQQEYNTLQQDFQQFAQSNGQSSSPTASQTNPASISVNV